MAKARRAHGEGSIYQRRDGKWIGTIEAGENERGKRRRITVSGKSEAEVTRKLRDRRIDLSGASSTASARTTVAAYAKRWLEVRATEVRPSTYSGDRSAVRLYIVPSIGRRRLSELTAGDIREVENAVRRAGHGVATRVRTRTALMTMLRDALGDGHAVPASLFQVAADRNKKDGKVTRDGREALTIAQAVAVLAQAADDPLRVRWMLGFLQGMRQGERLGLTWDQIDFDRALIHLEWQLQQLPYRERFGRSSSGFRVPNDYEARRLVGRFHLVRPKSSSGWRTIPIVPTVQEALLQRRTAAGDHPDGLVFFRALDGWPIDKRHDSLDFQGMQERAGVHHPSGRLYVGHEMRNTTASLLLELGTPEIVISAILGHSKWATTRGYVTTRDEQMRAALTQVAHAFSLKELG